MAGLVRELRTCPVTGRVVLLNPGWIDLPAPVVAPPPVCWHCGYAGTVIARDDDRVAVPHPVPALGIEGDPRATVYGGGVRRDGVGAHELLFGPHSDGDAVLLRLAARRMADLRQDTRLRGFGLTRHHSPGAHVAWQLFALPFPVPTQSPAGWREHERVQGERVLFEADGATAILAWAPRVPFETWVLPTEGLGGFESAGLAGWAAAAQALATALDAIARALRNPPVDLVLVDGEPWRIELLPRLSRAGSAVEVATGMPVHGVFPEAAAEWLREAGVGMGRPWRSSG